MIYKTYKYWRWEQNTTSIALYDSNNDIITLNSPIAHEQVKLTGFDIILKIIQITVLKQVETKGCILCVDF